MAKIEEFSGFFNACTGNFIQKHCKVNCQASIALYNYSFLDSHSAGSTEVGVQGVPGHTQYLPPPLVKTQFWLEKFEFVYLWAHPMFVGFRRP